MGNVITMHARDGSVKAVSPIDAEDQHLERYRWYLGRDGYAYRNISRFDGGGHIALHREIMGLHSAGAKVEVDHRNRDKLDNRRDNLVVVSSWQNKQNIPVKGRSKYRGVTFHRQSEKWRARCQIRGQVHYLGYYKTEDEAGAAARAYRLAHMEYALE